MRMRNEKHEKTDQTIFIKNVCEPSINVISNYLRLNQTKV